MKNKKGLITIGLTGGLALAAIIIIAIVIFLVLGSGLLLISWILKNIFFLIGGTIIVLGLIYGLSKSKNPGTFILIITLLGVAVMAVNFLGIQETAIPSGEYIQAPVFMYYDCAPASSPINSPITVLQGGSSNGWLKCPDNTDSCDLYIQQTEEVAWFSSKRRIVYQRCDKDLQTCDAQVIKTTDYLTRKTGYPTLVIYNLNKDDRVWIDYQALSWTGFYWNNQEGAQYYYRYKPFILWKNSIFGGGRTEYTSIEQGCVFPTTDRRNLIKNSLNLNIPHTSTSSNSVELPPYKTRNFIDTYVPISKENVNFVEYEGKTGYCLNRRIYSIATVNTESYTYRIVDTNLNTVLKPSVDCCPGEKEPTRKCNDNFEWEELEGSECSFFNPCAGAEWYPSGKPKELIRYECVNGYCVPKTKIEECTSDTDCIGNPKGNICDTKTWECTTLPVPEPEPDLLTPTSKADCDRKAIDQPYLGWTWIEKEHCGFWCNLGLSKPTTTSYCKATFVIYYVLGGIAILFLGAIIITMRRKK